MLISKELIRIPSRKIIVDLASRNGSPNRASTCPYKGREQFLYDQTKEYSGSSLALLERDSVSDYDAKKQKPEPGPYRQRDKDSYVGNYLTRLEDIDPSWVYKYFENSVVSIKVRAADSIKEENKNHKTARVFEDSEGDMVSENELMVEKPEYSYSDVLSWKEKVPYILKRLHEKSKAMTVSVMSLLIAYERVLRRTHFNPKPTQVLEEGVYRMTKEGYLGQRITQNKGPFHEQAMKWMRGDDGFKDSYHKDAMELLDICERLDIDIRAEDPFDFQEDFINSLTVLYITKNRDFLSLQNKSLNTEVLKELKRISIEDYGKSTKLDSQPDQSLVVDNKLQKFLDSTHKKIDKSRNMEQQTWIFGYLLGMCIGKDINIGAHATRKGFYITNDRKPLLLDVTHMVRDPKPSGTKVTCAVHSSGYLVLITNTVEMYYLDIETATEYQSDYNRNAPGFLNKKYGNNQKFGKWDFAFS